LFRPGPWLRSRRTRWAVPLAHSHCIRRVFIEILPPSRLWRQGICCAQELSVP
ncbi:unnamed protein product, partial [Closterium sp. Naga37s-1]